MQISRLYPAAFSPWQPFHDTYFYNKLHQLVIARSEQLIDHIGWKYYCVLIFYTQFLPDGEYAHVKWNAYIIEYVQTVNIIINYKYDVLNSGGTKDGGSCGSKDTVGKCRQVGIKQILSQTLSQSQEHRHGSWRARLQPRRRLTRYHQSGLINLVLSPPG